MDDSNSPIDQLIASILLEVLREERQSEFDVESPRDSRLAALGFPAMAKRMAHAEDAWLGRDSLGFGGRRPTKWHAC
jgi:hypothetical protein